MILQSEEEAFGEQEEGVFVPLEFESLDSSEGSVEPVPGTEPEATWRAQIAELQARIATEAETARREAERVRVEAERETRAEMTAVMEEKIAEERAAVAKLIAGFEQERVRYFAEVEREVVSLALAVAARVLHREASLDPMLLRAVVRVALDKVSGESDVTLRVPLEQVQTWSEVIAEERRADVVTVTGDDRLAAGDAVLETSVGRVELGVAEQLKEIERGFFDLLARRPQ